MVALEVAFTMMAAAWACTQESKVTCNTANKGFTVYVLIVYVCSRAPCKLPAAITTGARLS